MCVSGDLLYTDDPVPLVSEFPMTLCITESEQRRMPSPATGAGASTAENLMAHLIAIRDFREPYRPDGMEYSCIEEFVLRQGRMFDVHKWTRQPGMRRGRTGQCFKNAFGWAHRAPERYRYCEGVAVGASRFPVVHAWVIDTKGRVIDPTWKDQERGAYIGVTFKIDYVVKRVIECGMYTSMIDGALLKEPFAIMRGLHAPDMWQDTRPLDISEGA